MFLYKKPPNLSLEIFNLIFITKLFKVCFLKKNKEKQLMYTMYTAFSKYCSESDLP